MKHAFPALTGAILATLWGCGSSSGAGGGAVSDAGPDDASGQGTVTRQVDGSADASVSRDASTSTTEGGETPSSGSDAALRSEGGESGAGSDPGSDAASSGSFFFSAYKDTGIGMSWNTNVVSTSVSGTMTPLASDLAQASARTITLAFATGECGAESWGGVAGDAIASANVPLLTSAGVRYVVSTGGAAGSFTCATDAGMTTFVGRWASPGLVGIDFDIEAGQSAAVIGALIERIAAAHAASPGLRFSLTLGTLANNAGASSATSLGASVDDSFNTYGDEAMAAVESSLGFKAGDPSTWPGYVTVNLMTMDYGSASAGVCVVASGKCQMGQSALQAAYNLHDRLGVPYASIELTPMIGQNDASDEQFTLADVDTVAAFARSQGLAGVHYWSYDRDVDCATGAASATCASMGSGYAGARGFLARWLAAGL